MDLEVLELEIEAARLHRLLDLMVVGQELIIQPNDLIRGGKDSVLRDQFDQFLELDERGDLIVNHGALRGFAHLFVALEQCVLDLEQLLPAQTDVLLSRFDKWVLDDHKA